MPDARTFKFEKFRDLVRAEYHEMPDLCLTPSQMRKSWNLDVSTCDLLVDQLVAAWTSVVAAADAGAR